MSKQESNVIYLESYRYEKKCAEMNPEEVEGDDYVRPNSLLDLASNDKVLMDKTIQEAENFIQSFLKSFRHSLW